MAPVQRGHGGQESLGTLRLELSNQGKPRAFCLWRGAQHKLDGQVNRLKVHITPVSRNQNGPQGRCHDLQISWIVDFLMADPFGPGHCWYVGQVVHRNISSTVPACCLLPWRLPEEWIPAIADEKAEAKRAQRWALSGGDQSEAGRLVQSHESPHCFVIGIPIAFEPILRRLAIQHGASTLEPAADSIGVVNPSS
jgi:hypothetical protein